MKITLCAFCLIFFLKVSAQQCNCKQMLLNAIKNVEENYAGFSDKVNIKTRPAYEKVKRKCLDNAGVNKSECIEVIYEYLNFFKDAHLILTSNNNKITVESNQDIFKSNTHPGGITGKWYSAIDGTVINVIKKNGRYYGYVVSSNDTAIKKGMLIYDFKTKAKNDYQAIVHNEFGQKIIYTATLKDKQLIVHLRETLTRNTSDSYQNVQFAFKKMNDSVGLIKMSSFSLYFKQTAEKLVEDNRSGIESSKYLIIDIRDNHGGSVLSFRKLFDYIYTNPTCYISGYYWLSEGNINKAEQTLRRNKPYFDSLLYVSQQKQIDSFKKTLNHFYFERPDTLTRKKIYSNPEKIVLLVNRYTASAAEMLVIMAKQNKKTVTAGLTTFGSVDYLEPLFYELCGDDLLIGIPWAKRSRLEYQADIDNKGIKPDINMTGIDEREWVNHLIHARFFSAK